jgi:hypothetical protein
MAPTINKYASVVTSLGRPMPAWVKHENDAVRVAAYDGYDDMYKNVPETFKVVLRGEEDTPIYVPSAKKIVEATNRYLGKDWRWVVRSIAATAEAANLAAGGGDPSGPGPAEQSRLALQTALEALFVRERMLIKFGSWKRHMVQRGDALLHIQFDESRPQGSRISIGEINPRTYFPIPDPFDELRVIGAYIVDLITVGTEQIARRLEYRKIQDQDQVSAYKVPIGQVYTRLTFWEIGGWDDRYPDSGDLKPKPVPEAYTASAEMAPLLTGMPLPDTVTALPLYHVRNQADGDEAFGTSQIAGIETLIAGINQGVSDEDITLALQGLGVYTTTSKRPIDPDTGEETDWVIAPGIVLEMASPTDKLERVEGLKNMQPFQEHLTYLGKALDEGTGLSPVAVGTVDAAAATSGVALRLEMAPILAQNEEKETELLGTLDQMLHDIVFMWLPLEGVRADPADITIVNSFADPLPIDRAAVIKEITDLFAAKLISAEFAVKYLSDKLGFQFPADMLNQITAAADQAAARAATELGVGAAIGTGVGAVA